MLPKFPVQIGFDIANHEDTKEVWAHDQARTLALLWRPCHIVNQYYWEETLAIGKEIEKRKPQTIEELAACFGTELQRGSATNYTRHDVLAFLPEALPYFTGKAVHYAVTADSKEGDTDEV